MKVTSNVGTIKNITVRGANNNVVTANFSERNSEGRCINTMPLVFIGDKVKLIENIPGDSLVTLTGNVVTRFDRRPGIPNEQRFKPFTQIEVDSIVLA
jgi:hypothetical protein